MEVDLDRIREKAEVTDQKRKLNSSLPASKHTTLLMISTSKHASATLQYCIAWQQ